MEWRTQHYSRGDLRVRMLAVAALTLAITAAAATLGPMLRGIVGTHPVAISVVLTFTNAQLRRAAALAMLRGNALSWIAFTSSSLDALRAAPSIGLGVLAAISRFWCFGRTGKGSQARAD